jgi:PAS domain S-box-containing protein
MERARPLKCAGELLLAAVWLILCISVLLSQEERMAQNGRKRPGGKILFSAPVMGTILAGALISCAGAFVAMRVDRQVTRLEFEKRAEAWFESIKRESESNLHALVSLKALYGSNQEVDRFELKEFADNLLMIHPSLQAIGWAPEVSLAERADYENAAKRDGYPEFQIGERTPDGKMIRAGDRAEYFPVYYVEPYKGNEAALGFDLASNSVRREALERARNMGKMSTSMRVKLVPDKASTERYGVLTFAPIYSRGALLDSVAERRKSLEGLVFCVVRVGDIVDKALDAFHDDGMEAFVRDKTAPEAESILYAYPPGAGKGTRDFASAAALSNVGGGLEVEKTLWFANREWAVRMRATSKFIGDQDVMRPWQATGIGLFLTFLVAGYLVVQKRNEEALRESEEAFRTLVKSAPEAIFVLDRGHFAYVNEVAVRLLGGASEKQLLGASVMERFHPDTRSEAAERMRRLDEEGAPVPLLEQKCLKLDGTPIDVEVSAIPLLYEKRPAAVVFARDVTDRKRAGDQLREAKEYMENIFENSPDGIGIVDAGGRFIRWNKMAEELFGYTCEELKGRPAFDLYADDAELRSVMELVRSEGAVKKLPVHMRRKDGSVSVFEISISLLRSGAGDVMGSICVARDLSDIRKALKAVEATNEQLQREIEVRRQVEETLRESERRFREILENIHLLAVSLDARGDVAFCNDFFLSLTGWRREEVLGRSWFETFAPPGTRAELKKSYLESMAAGTIPMHREEEIDAYFGKRLLISWSNTLLRDPKGNVIGATMIGQDIGQRRKMEKELRKASAEMEHLIASIPSAIMELSAESAIVRWNAAAEKMFGLSSLEVLGMKIESCPVRWDAGRVASGLAECVLKREAVRVVDMRFSNRDEKEGLLSLTISPIIGESGELTGVIVLGVDVTEHRRLERQLAQAQKLESIGQLAAGIAHEINTPTQYVGDNTRFIQEGFNDIMTLLDRCAEAFQRLKEGGGVEDAVRDFDDAAEAADLEYLRDEIPKAIGQSLEGVERVSKIVLAMKEFSHPGSAEKTAIDINRAIESTITVARNEWKYVAEMETDFDASMPLVQCLPGELNQVFLNMIVNASHAIAEKGTNASDAKGTITVRTRNLGDRAEISISDTGAGIPERIRSRIFDPFFTTKEVGRGTGQGLSIAYSVVVEKHGGSIHFESEVGVGTTFVIQLPIVEVEVLKGGSK